MVLEQLAHQAPDLALQPQQSATIATTCRVLNIAQHNLSDACRDGLAL